MAKVTITIEDSADDQATLTTEFDPPLGKDAKSTPALELALTVLKALKADPDVTDWEPSRVTSSRSRAEEEE